MIITEHSALAKEKRAIERLKSFEPEDGYYLCYSGGKDSDTIKILASLAGIKHESVHNLTTVDAPETVRYIQSQKDVKIEKPEKTMWQLIPEKGMPPTRMARYCCAELKERGGKGKLKITGVRWDESSKRTENADVVKVIGKPKTNQKTADEIGAEYKVTKQGGMVLNYDDDKTRRFVEQCYRTSTAMINPIVDWLDGDVWGFLRHYGCDSNPLYHTTGCHRIGCIGCPIGGSITMQNEFARYPKYRANYVRAFDRMLDKVRAKGIKTNEKWKNGESVMLWWLGINEDQLYLFGDDDD